MTITKEMTTVGDVGDQVLSIVDQGLVSRETYIQLFTIANYFMYPLTFVGFISCVFSVAVYSAKRMRSPSNTYLAGLNLMELGNVVTATVMEALGLVYGSKSRDKQIYLWVHLYLNIYLGAAIRRTTYILSCLLSAERCIAIVFPLKAKQFKIVKNPILTVICVTFISLLFHVFITFKYSVVPYFSTSTNETLWKLQYTNTYQTIKSEHEAWSLASKVIFVYIPLLSCLIFNFVVVFRLKQQSQIRRTMVGNNEAVAKFNERRTTIIVLISTFALVLLALPSSLNSMASQIVLEYNIHKREHYLFLSVMRIGKLCELISNCLGFFFYVTLSSQFRKIFIMIFCSCRKSNRTKGSSRNANDTSISLDTNLSMISEP